MASETLKRQRNRKIRLRDSRNSEAKRRLTLKNKAKELAILCDTNVCLVCFGPDGEVETWPESKAEVEQVFNKYKKNGGKNVRESLGLLGFLASKKAELDRKLGEISNGDTEEWFSSLEEKINRFSQEELLGFCNNLGHKIQNLSEKLGMMQARETQNQNQNQYAVVSSCYPNCNRNDDQLNTGTQCNQPSEALGWFDADWVLATAPVISEVSPEGYYTNILSNSHNNNSLSPTMMFGNQPVLAAPVDEHFYGECYVNAEAPVDEPFYGECYVNAEGSGNNQDNCLPDHRPVFAAHPENNEEWNGNNNITTNNHDDSCLLLGLEDPNWFWGTSDLCFP